MTGKHSLTATNLAVYQHLNCDLYIHNVSSGTIPASANPGSAGRSSPSEISRAHYKRGLEWETALFSWLDHSNLLLKVPPIPIEGRSLLENILADDREHFFITGLTFWPPQAKLVEKFKAEGTQPLEFGLAKPDLLEIQRNEDGVVWKVIDAKASRYVKSSHHIQIYFYTLCLNYLLEPPYFHGQDSVAVWLPPSDGFHTNPPSLDDIMSISSSMLGPPLDGLLFRSLPKVIALPREDVKWHFNPLCHGCRYESDCRDRAVDGGELGSMPNISIDDARVLKDLLRMSRPRTRPSPHSLPDIEELHNLVGHHELESLKRTSLSVVKRAKQILSLPKFRIEGQSQSPMIEAARTKMIQVIPRRNYTCPRQEDIAICISVVNDPSSPVSGGNYFCVTSFARHRGIQIPPPISSSNEDFIPKLAGLIRSIDSSTHTSQFYVWSASEHGLLQAHIINAALTSAANEVDVRLCIGSFMQGASLLQTSFQPLLSGALLSFFGRDKKLKADYQKCLSRLGLSTEGTVDVLRKRLQEESRRLQDTSTSPAINEVHRKEFGQLSKVVILKKEVGRQLALPVPGYWDLPDCVAQLLPDSSIVCPDDEQILTAYKCGETDALSALLFRRNDFFYGVLKELRLRALSASGHTLFVNEAKRLSTKFMDFCTQPHIRKLFFMQQFEVLAKLAELWQTRIDACPEAPTLEYRGSVQGKDGELKSFRILSGTVDVLSSDKDRAFYDKLLVVDAPDSLSDEDCEDRLPVEALFDDLGVSGLVFPLNRFTKSNWTRQDPRIRQEVWVADVRNVYTERCHSMVSLRVWGTCEASLIPGTVYRLSPRLVDFNTTKVLAALFELDLKWESSMEDFSAQEQECYPHAFIPFMQLVLDPTSFGQIPAADQYVKTEKEIQTLFKRLKDLGNGKAGSLVLKASQHRATQRIMGNKLSVIWGPPGTGKTHTISLSLLRLIDVERRLYGPQPKVVFVTAITHAAIEACRSKLVRLMDTYRSIANMPNEWLTDTSIEVVSTGNNHPAPLKTGRVIHIYMGTIYQLYNFTKKHALEIDCLIIDEAGQISLCSVSLVLRSLASYGRVIIAGDSEQLAPILSAHYPLLKSHALFGSVLDCLMYSRSHLEDRQERDESQGSQGSILPSASSQGTVIQLTENFRLNPDLGEFVSTIYSRRFKPQKLQARQLAIALKTVADIGGNFGSENKLLEAVKTFLASLSSVMLDQPQKALVAPEIRSIQPETSGDISLPHRPVSLALIRLRTWSKHTRDISYELHVQAEAALAASLVLCLQKCSPQDDIFVATPHRIQREAVKAALSRIRDTSLEEAFKQLRVSSETPDGQAKVTVDTIERLQGSEAAFVICLFSVPQTYSLDLAFLLERRRLNVAISRARTLCILVSSDEVLCPSLKIFANADAAKGYAFLKAFQKRAWSYNIALQVDAFA